MCGAIVRSGGPSAPTQPGLLALGPVTGNDTNVSPGLLLKILGGQLDPTDDRLFHAPAFGEYTGIFTRNRLTLGHFLTNSGLVGPGS